jgi:hypothetical protein
MRLREKTEPDPSNSSLIKTVRGSGYVFAAAAVGITLPQQMFDLRDRMMSEILGHLGNDLGFGFLCKLAPEIAENFRRRHDHKVVERAWKSCSR